MNETDTTNEDMFRVELSALINRYSLEGRSNTPDFVLADYLMDCLLAYERSTNRTVELRSKVLSEVFAD